MLNSVTSIEKCSLFRVNFPFSKVKAFKCELKNSAAIVFLSLMTRNLKKIVNTDTLAGRVESYISLLSTSKRPSYLTRTLPQKLCEMLVYAKFSKTYSTFFMKINPRGG